MGGKIDAYVDCSSPYSFFALVYLRKNRKLLAQYGVEVEFHPFFLGGINQATGNKPPSTLPAKGAYGPYDMRRGCTFFSTPLLSSPPFFPLVSLLPQRAMLAIKSLVPTDKFEDVYEGLWIAVFNKHIDIAKPELLTEVLGEYFGEDEVKRIIGMAQQKEFKDQLVANTKAALEKGAFGAPWFWMRNAETKHEEPLFGSDRWSYMFKFMGVEVRELEIVDKEGDRTGISAKL